MENTEFPSESTPPSDEKPQMKRSSLSFVWLVVFVLLLGNVFLLFFFPSEETPIPKPDQSLEQEQDSFNRLSFWQRLWQNKEETLEKRYSDFDGLEIDPDTEERLISVMIDNHSLAWPQHAGVRSASIVYEALVEGGITRLMLLYPYQELSRVGPVRSARDYFVDIAEEYGGLYIHAGGAPTALEKLWDSDRLYSIEEDIETEGKTYSYRDNDLEVPHNLFFDLLLTKLWAEDQNYPLSKPKKSWCFNHLQKETEESASSSALLTEQTSLITLDYSNDISSSYYVQFQYDEASDSYKRYYGSSNRQPHMDDNESLQVAPTNIVIQIAPSSLIEGDEKERLDMHHIGEGKAFYFLRGEMIEGHWEKPTAGAVTRFYDQNEEEMCFNPGQIWVGILDDESLIGIE